MKKIISFVIIIVMLCVFSIVSIAASVGELQGQKNELQSEIDNAHEHLDGITFEMTETLKDVARLSAEIAELQKDINKLNDEIAVLEEGIEENQKKLDISQASFTKQEKQYIDTLVAQYKAGNITYLDILAGSDSVVDFISNYFLASRLAQYNVDLLDKIESEKMKIEVLKTNLENQKKQLVDAKTTVESKANALEATKSVKDSYVARLSEQEKATQNKIEELEEEQRQIEADIRELMRNDGSPYTGGAFRWPVPYTTNITAYYQDPSYSVEIGHTHYGMDIAAWGVENTPAVAAANGVVILAQYYGGYGNCVWVDHGGGLVSIYGHGNSILVNEGDYVIAGDPLILIGSTGNSTGPHLHFEVRVDGYTVDPLNYFY